MNDSPTSWHGIEKYSKTSWQELFSNFESTENGLNNAVARKLQKKYKENIFTTRVKRHELTEFLNNFTNPLVIILVLIATISFLMGEVVNGIIIGCMVLLSATLNYFQEHRASKAVDLLLKKVALRVMVIREGKEVELPASDIVRGDLLKLNAGDMIPADGRVWTSSHCYVNQSALTGESLPVEKTEAENNNLVYAGTSVTSGMMTMMVLATGMDTEFSRLLRQINQKEEPNDFTLGIHQFSTNLMKLIVILVALIFLVSTVFRHDWFTSFSFAIAVAVGLTPEFLPMILSVTMTGGSLIMAKKGIIVKKLTAIPAFGSMDLLCTDKTGTLTEDRIQLVQYTDIHGRTSEKVLNYAYLNSALESGITNPLDEAIKAFRQVPVTDYKKIDELPFDFDRKKLSVIVDHMGQRLLISKGAPESIIQGATRVFSGEKVILMDEKYKNRINAEYQRLSAQGYRVLAISFKNLNSDRSTYTNTDELESTFLGFTSFLDPVKKDIRKAIDALEVIGIKVKVISGDNELICKKICDDADIPIEGIMLGTETETMEDEELAKRLETTSICARFAPAQKERVIRLLRQNGHVVGYIGDGINDAPSLKAADVGISVVNAVDVARETADLIMTRKSFQDLYAGIIAGRTIFGNTMKYLMMGLSSNFGNMISMLGAVIFLPFLPMLPLQLLLNNFLYDFAQITIPTDAVDPEYVMLPKRWNLGFIKRFMFTLGPVSTLFDFVSFLVLYHFFRGNPAGFQTGWFMESLATQALVIHVIRTRKIPLIQSRPSLILLGSTVLVVLVGWLIPFLSIGQYFGFTPLSGNIVGMIMIIVGIYLIMTQCVKSWFYKREEQR